MSKLRPYKFTAIGRRVVGIDGEGNDEPISPGFDTEWGSARHAYNMLAYSDDTGNRDSIVHDDSRREGEPGITQPNYGLPTVQCLEFMLNIPRDPSDLIFWFSGTYDCVKTISDLPLANLNELAKTERTEWNGYLIRFRPRKFFQISVPRYGKIRGADGIYRYRRSVMIWDSFGYFQMGFVSALKGATHLFTQAEIAMLPVIERMKKLRSQFADMSRDEILKYCYLEVLLLAKMMRELIVSTEAMGLYPRSFHGASAISTEWMRQENIKDHIGDAGIPDEIINAAYYGGRFENRGVGIAPRGLINGEPPVIRYSRKSPHRAINISWAADIRSAYPAQLVKLPCLMHATSRRVTEYEPGKYGVYLVGSKTSGPWAPFPIRIPNQYAREDRSNLPASVKKWRKAVTSKQVLFAHGGMRWVYQDELAIARKHFGDDAIPVYDGYVIEPNCDCPPPFANIQKLYDWRRDIKREIKRTGVYNALEKVIKLLINAIYGKTAQSVGWAPRKGITQAQVNEARRIAQETGNWDHWSTLVEPPEFLCRIWAGMITSNTRALMLDLIMMAPDHALTVATDGTVFDIPIKPLIADREGPELGMLELAEYYDLVLYQSGVYTYWEETDEPGVYEQKMKSRGFSPQDITPEMLRQAWNNGEWSVAPIGDARGFIPLRQAMSRKNPLNVMGQWGKQKRPVDFMPTKRWLQSDPLADERDSWLETDVRTLPDDLMSLPYEPKQSWEEIAEIEGWIGDAEGDDEMVFLHDDEIDEPQLPLVMPGPAPSNGKSDDGYPEVWWSELDGDDA